MYYIIRMLTMFLIDIIEAFLSSFKSRSRKNYFYSVGIQLKKQRKLQVKMVSRHAFRLFSTPDSSEPIHLVNIYTIHILYTGLIENFEQRIIIIYAMATQTSMTYCILI